MSRFFLKLLLASSPILLVLVIYFYNDPFKVLYHYDNYYPQTGTPGVPLDKDFVSTETLINNYGRYKYDSYIFGNSRSIRYRVNDWEKHIKSQNCYHFDASGESLLGIAEKIEFLHDRGMPIRNALFVIDQDVLRKTKKDEEHIFTIDPNVSKQNKLSFQFVFLKAFLYPDFLENYIQFLCFKKVNSKSSIGWKFFDNDIRQYNPISNELYDVGLDEAIKSNRDSFYLANKHIFYERENTQHYYSAVIGKEQERLLNKIKEILDEEHTNYKIVISPLYDQLKIDSTDLKLLYIVFGKNNVYDFSGINDMTQSVYNYYENSHYRPFIAGRIMDSIYNQKGTNE